MRFLQFSAFKKKTIEKRSKSKKFSNILKSGLFGMCKKNLDENGHISMEQKEFEYDTWKLYTKKVKIDFFVRESINIPTFSTR
jgi:hypothetical protein